MGLRCGVYWNNHKRLFSIRNEDVSTQGNPNFHYGRVIAHAQNVWMGQSTFQVSTAGRERAQDEGRKNVHARVLGEVFAVSGRWNFPRSTENVGFLTTTYCNMEIISPAMTSQAAFFDERGYVDDKYVLGIWNQSEVEGTYAVHYHPWAGPAHFTTFANEGVWAVQTAEAVGLSCMVKETDTEETLRRPCVTVPVKGSVVTEIEETTNAPEII